MMLAVLRQDLPDAGRHWRTMLRTYGVRGTVRRAVDAVALDRAASYCEGLSRVYWGERDGEAWSEIADLLADRANDAIDT